MYDKGFFKYYFQFFPLKKWIRMYKMGEINMKYLSSLPITMFTTVYSAPIEIRRWGLYLFYHDVYTP